MLLLLSYIIILYQGLRYIGVRYVGVSLYGGEELFEYGCLLSFLQDAGLVICWILRDLAIALISSVVTPCFLVVGVVGVVGGKGQEG